MKMFLALLEIAGSHGGGDNENLALGRRYL
jgi:hypothetical protein